MQNEERSADTIYGIIQQKSEYGKGANPMQTTKQNTTDKSNNKPLRLTKRIGSTTYKVNVNFSETSKETIGDKIIRLIQSEAVNQ